MKTMMKRIALIATAGIALGIGTATLVGRAGEANADDVLYDASPAVGSGSGSAVVLADAAFVAPPPGTTLPPLPNIDSDAGGFILASYKWIMAGGWLALVPFLIAVIWVCRNPKTWPLSKWVRYQTFISTTRGAAILSLTLALAGMGLHVILATGGAPTAAALKVALLTGGLAAGLYSLGKAIIFNK